MLLSVVVSIKGKLAGCNADAIVGNVNGKPCLFGTMDTYGKSPEEIASGFGISSDFSDGVFKDFLPLNLPDKMSVSYTENIFTSEIRDKDIIFKFSKFNNSSAVLFSFESFCSNKNLLSKFIKAAADFFAVKNFLFYSQSGNISMFKKTLPSDIKLSCFPKQAAESKTLILSSVDFTVSDSVFARAVKLLFGLEKTDLFIIYSDLQTRCIIGIPSFSNKFISGQDMYIEMDIKSGISFKICGCFTFSFVAHCVFNADCAIAPSSFVLSTYTFLSEPIPLFGPFSIGDTCLTIEIGSKIKFSMYTNLFIREIQLFGALTLQIKGQAVVPQLISACVSDLTIPRLINNLAGRIVEGVEILDFIKISGLSFQKLSPYTKDVLKNGNLEKISNDFNAQINSEQFQLETDKIKLTPFAGGYDLTDLKHMRHYFISSDGNLQLTAQFYYASENDVIGNYTIEKGIFLCGSIEIFNKKFEVLFSYCEGMRLLAYAKIPEINLGFIKMSSSGIKGSENEFLPILQNSILSQFFDFSENNRDMIFFLQAEEKDVSFYFDGKLVFLNFITASARLIYSQGYILADIRTEFAGLLYISLHLKVAYSDFTNAKFEFCFIMDTSGLTEKLKSVTAKIDNAIGKLREKMNNANKEIDRAQAHVNELYSQIKYFDDKIAQCRYSISHAKWWKKAFVAIAKGVEIGGYEIAKAGIYAAIGVATAALNVAKGMLTLSECIGEGVLKAVNGVIKGAMSLFYINYIRLSASAGTFQQGFQAKIQFVAFGKTYTFEKRIGDRSLNDSPVSAIEDAIDDTLSADLNNIENGSFRSNWNRYKIEKFTTLQQCSQMDEAKIYLSSSVKLMKNMQNNYLSEFSSPIVEFDEMNISVMNMLDDLHNIFNTAESISTIKELAYSMGALKRSIRAKEKKGKLRGDKLNNAKALITEYDETRLLYDKICVTGLSVRRSINSMEKQYSGMKSAAKACGKEITSSKGNLAVVIDKTERDMYSIFPVERNDGSFINLSRERLIRECFEKTDKEVGRNVSDDVVHMRSKSRKGIYKSRL